MEKTLTTETTMESEAMTGTFIGSALSILSTTLAMINLANSRLEKISEKTVKSFDKLNEMLPGGHRWENPKPIDATKYMDVSTESISIVIERLRSRLSAKRDAENLKNPLVALGGEELYQSMITLPDIAISIIDNADDTLLSLKVSIPSSEFTVGELTIMHSWIEYLIELDILNPRVEEQILEPILMDSDKRACLKKYAHILPETLKSPVYGDFVVCKILCDYDYKIGIVNVVISLKPWVTSKRDQVFYEDVVRMLIERYLEKHPEDEYI